MLFFNIANNYFPFITMKKVAPFHMHKSFRFDSMPSEVRASVYPIKTNADIQHLTNQFNFYI